MLVLIELLVSDIMNKVAAHMTGSLNREALNKLNFAGADWLA